MSLHARVAGALRGPLQALDAALVDPQPASHAARLPSDLDAACRTLRLALTGLGTALPPLLACIDGSDGTPGVQRLRLQEVDDRVDGLVELYRGIARMSLLAGGAPVNERLVDAARDALVLLAHGLAALVAGARDGVTATAEMSIQLPDDAAELASWRPQRLAYDRGAVQRALRDSPASAGALVLPAGVELVVQLGGPATDFETSEDDYATRLRKVRESQRADKEIERGLFWAIVGIFSLGWWLSG